MEPKHGPGWKAFKASDFALRAFCEVANPSRCQAWAPCTHHPWQKLPYTIARFCLLPRHGLNPNLGGRQSRCFLNCSSGTLDVAPMASYGLYNAACANGGVRFWWLSMTSGSNWSDSARFSRRKNRRAEMAVEKMAADQPRLVRKKTIPHRMLNPNSTGLNAISHLPGAETVLHLRTHRLSRCRSPWLVPRWIGGSISAGHFASLGRAAGHTQQHII